jgi:basic membrane lipoprotein Med (substrate-binding protein (PBP1-ABC) superfamily)
MEDAGSPGIQGFDVARENGGLGIWVDTDGFYTVPGAQDVMLTSVMKKVDISTFEVIKAAQEVIIEG